jgi:hypothetical protein
MGKVRDMAQKLQLSLKRVLPKSRAWFSHVFRRSPEPARHVAVHEGHMAQLRERPEWQADKDAPICTRCRAEFTFFFRKVSTNLPMAKFSPPLCYACAFP